MNRANCVAYSLSDGWKGVFHNLVGLNLEFASKQQGAEIKSNPEFTDMPCFPNEGYIKEIDGVMVIKASNGY